jgi:hypothetical protein
MRAAETFLREYEDAAWHIAEVPLDETCWDEARRATVVALIERGNDIVDGLVGTSGTGAIRWHQSEPPVILARAFGRTHQLLAAAVRQAGRRVDSDAAEAA